MMPPPGDANELTTLVDRARNGDLAAANELCSRLEPRLRRLARSAMGPRARRWGDSGDLVQQVLLEVLVTNSDMTVGAAPDQLLAQLARRIDWRIADLVRNRAREAGASAFGSRVDPADRQRSMGSVTREDSLRWLDQLVAALPEPWSSTVRLCGLEGLSYASAGRRLGVHEDTVRKRYEKAREVLRRRVNARRQRDEP